MAYVMLVPSTMRGQARSSMTFRVIERRRENPANRFPRGRRSGRPQCPKNGHAWTTTRTVARQRWTVSLATGCAAGGACGEASRHSEDVARERAFGSDTDHGRRPGACIVARGNFRGSTDINNAGPEAHVLTRPLYGQNAPTAVVRRTTSLSPFSPSILRAQCNVPDASSTDYRRISFRALR